MESTENLLEEIRQIKNQYKAEVTGHSKQWPLAIKKRILKLSDSGMRVKTIAEHTGISYHTIAVWKTRHSGKQSFHNLPVVAEAKLKPGPKKLVTVADTKKRKSIVIEKSATVTVTTPEGFIIQLDSPATAAKFIMQLRRD